MRGSPISQLTGWDAYGIIPAHAGLTLLGAGHRRSGGDHPRACGAHILYESLIVYGLGSSPRMRGSRLASALPRTSAGIIPAHAGLTRPTAALAVAHRDHPRACGAHVRPIVSLNSRWGSSPRMRGSPTCLRIAVRAGGIIPAHAGLTSRRATRRGWVWDHPRACGAHPCPVRSRFFYPGSSPRMRGSQLLHSLLYSSSGIIPAHAGLTRRRASPSAGCSKTVLRRDHPRACGAHAGVALRGGGHMGSSPRMRGSHSTIFTFPAPPGIIPAHAGLTLIKRGDLDKMRDHPRACGAHTCQ